MRVSVLVGNPRPRSGTWDAAHRIAAGLGGGAVRGWDLADLGPGLLDPADAATREVQEDVCSADVVVVASPTYKASFTGLLKLFLDRLPTSTGLEGVVAVPLMRGGSPAHQLAGELHLKPVLVELGATVPAPALFVLDKPAPTDSTEHDWLARWQGVIERNVGSVG